MIKMDLFMLKHLKWYLEESKCPVNVGFFPFFFFFIINKESLLFPYWQIPVKGDLKFEMIPQVKSLSP